MNHHTMLTHLRGYSVWDVYVGNNYYNGRYADYGFRAVPVLASSETQARNTVLKYRNSVLEQLKQRRYNEKRRMLPPRTALEITEQRLGTVRQGGVIRSTLEGQWKTILSPEGWVDVQLKFNRILAVKETQDAT